MRNCNKGAKLVKSKRKLIGVILSDATAEYSEMLLKGIIAQAKEYDYNVAVFSTFIKDAGAKKHKIGEQNIFNLPNYNKFDGIIFSPDTIKIEGVAAEIEEDLRKNCKCPVVCADISMSSFLKVPTDEAKDFKQIVNHFIKVHGFTRINCLTGPKGSTPSELRLEGYMDALRENNILIEPSRISYGDFWRDAGKAFVDNIMSSQDLLPQAIVCGNDYMAITVCNKLKEYGVRVPEDICVSGYDNVKEASLNTPSITTLKTPIESIGGRAVRYIHEIIRGVEVKDNSVLYGDLVMAESCGCGGNNLHMHNCMSSEKNYQYELDTAKDNFTDINLMGEDLIGASTLDDFLNGIREHLCLLLDYSDFYLCLCEDWDTIGQNEDSEDMPYIKVGYSKNMTIELEMENQIYKESHITFPVEDMLPALQEENETMRTFFFVPIHFKDRCYGYAVLTYGDQVKIFDFTYRSWARNINNTLEFVRVQNNLRWCYNRLDQVSVRDALTGIYNRRGFDRYAEDIYNSCIVRQKPFILLLGDLDNLKMINDHYGHLEGDNAIISVAKAFQSIDAENCVYARLGGDEFALVFRGDYTDNQITSYKQDIHKYMEDLNKFNKYPYSASISIGMYYGIPTYENRINDCINIADKRMYVEKNKKKYKKNL